MITVGVVIDVPEPHAARIREARRTWGDPEADAVPPHLTIVAPVSVDPGEMPAMNYPAPGGPALDAVVSAVASLHATGRVTAFSISSWNPELPGAEVAAAAMRRIAAPFL